MDTKRYKKGEIIFRQGDESHCMYDIVSGKVGIYADYGTKEEKELTKLGTECFFGQMGMIEGLPRSATAVALEAGTTLNAISPDNFKEYFKTRPAKVLIIMQSMSYRIRELTKDYLEACRVISESMEKESEDEDLMSFIEELAEMYTESDEEE